MKDQPNFSINVIPRTQAIIHGDIRNDADGYKYDMEFIRGYLHTYCMQNPTPNIDLYLNSNDHYVSNNSDGVFGSGATMRVGYTVMCYGEGNVLETVIGIATDLSNKFKHRRMIVSHNSKTYEIINNSI